MSMTIKTPNFIPAALLFEGLLGLVAIGLASWLDIELTSRLADGAGEVWKSVQRGVVATCPPLIALVIVLRSKRGPLARLCRLVEKLLGPLVKDASLWSLAALAIAAGCGEELLFRGTLQPWGARSLGTETACIVTSVLFGALHAASKTYFLFAAIMGLYLGWLSEVHGLPAAITSHALYDFAALWILRQSSLGRL